jgi:aspartyl-tRNA(Asn)/glutamyl-tRNA(Gln) amidotransferase subunit A
VVQDLRVASIDEIGGLYDAREISPIEVLEEHMAQLARTEPSLDAFMWVNTPEALNAAREAEDRLVRNVRRGPLDGIVLSMKDSEDIAGAPTTFGSRFFEFNIASADGLLASRLKRAGAIIIGKTTMPQFGYKDMGDNLLGKVCRNPWNLDLTSGGSSAGAAASLAAGVGQVAHGNDGGGSVRIPAAFCGLVGLKPSFGRVPYVHAGDRFALRSHEGPIARSVRDAAYLLEALAGPDSTDAFAIDSSWSIADVAPMDLRGVKVAYVPRIPGFGVDPRVMDAVDSACRVLESLGCHVEIVNPEWSDAPRVWSVLYTASKAVEFRERLAAHPEWFEPTFLELIEQGRATDAATLAGAMLRRTSIYDSVNSLFDAFDFLVMPTTPTLPWNATPGPHEGPGPIDGVGSGSLVERVAFTAPFNVTGHPAISVPCGNWVDGLPVGLQIVGPWHGDTHVLSMAAAFEAASPWHDSYLSLIDRFDAT